MMISYSLLAKLRTKLVKYEDVLRAFDSPTLEQLKEGSSIRKAIEDSINKNSTITEAIAREISGGLTSKYDQDIQKVDLYLPILENLVQSVEEISSDRRKADNFVAGLKIRWSSSLSSSSSLFHYNAPKFYQIDSLRFELGMILFLYGALHRERAQELLSTDMTQSATLLRKAAGIYHYLAENVLPPLQPVLPSERPPEVSPRVSSALSLICLAEAQAVTARKGEENRIAMKPDRPSESLLSKLHYGVRELFEEAVSKLNSEECKGITSRFLDYISSCQNLHQSKSYKFLAENLQNDGKVGCAIGVLNHGLEISQKNMPTEDSWCLVSTQLIQELSGLIKKYRYENDFVYQHKIPNQYDLPLPQGVKCVKMIPYIPRICNKMIVFNL